MDRGAAWAEAWGVVRAEDEAWDEAEVGAWVEVAAAVEAKAEMMAAVDGADCTEYGFRMNACRTNVISAARCMRAARKCMRHEEKQTR